jgi:hypothetical protein
MTRNLKMLGLACCAVLALAAFGAQTASANVLHHFKVGAAKADITATGHPTEPAQKFFAKPGGAAIECKQVHLEGTQVAETTTTLELTPTYTECSAAGFPLTVTDEGCKFVFHAETTLDPVTGVENAPTDLNCEGGKGKIDWKIPAIGCTITYSDRSGANTVNQGLHGIHYVNTQTSGEAETVTAEWHDSNIHYESTGCGLAGISNGTHATGTLLGKVTIKAYKSGTEHIVANQINDTIITT